MDRLYEAPYLKPRQLEASEDNPTLAIIGSQSVKTRPPLFSTTLAPKSCFQNIESIYPDTGICKNDIGVFRYNKTALDEIQPQGLLIYG